MHRFSVLFALCMLTTAVSAAWYWPFKGGIGFSKEPRLSELMEPATDLIDEASDLAAEGKDNEAVEKYREALLIIDRIEEENPGKADNPEFSTIRNKRAYVNAAIDALLLEQVRQNARAVAVSDTTALEKRLAEERAKKAGKQTKRPADGNASAKEKTERKAEGAKPEEEAKAAPVAQPVEKPVAKAAGTTVKEQPRMRALTPRERVMEDLSHGDYAAAALLIEEMLVEKPNDATALNLRAAMEAARGDLKAAEAALDQAIMSNPRNHFAYYNMARLKLQQTPPNRSAARRYYETGRSVGGPADKGLEERVR